jgi:hypothetical protein
MQEPERRLLQQVLGQLKRAADERRRAGVGRGKGRGEFEEYMHAALAFLLVNFTSRHCKMCTPPGHASLGGIELTDVGGR